MVHLSVEPAWCPAEAAEELAARHRLSSRPPAPIAAWSHVGEIQKWLQQARLASLEPPPDARKAAEWLLDNDYQVHRALRQIGADLPRNFYLRLPALASPDEEDIPRIFAIAHDLLRVSKLQVSRAGAVRFVGAYQQRTPLTIAELWAFPTMLRLACIEILVAAFSPLLAGRVPMPFAPTKWANEAHSLDETERVARAISNLDLIAAISWNDFFDQTSAVEHVLREDPSGYYPLTDFESRDRYRRAVEELAAWAAVSEGRVAAAVVAQARARTQDDPGSHVGYWLVGSGRPAIERRLGAHAPFRVRLLRFVLDRPGPCYAAGLLLFGAGALLLPSLYLRANAADPLNWLVTLLLCLIPASVLALTVLNWIITRTLPPRVLCKLDFKDGLPPDCRAVIVIPVVVTDLAEAAKLAEQLEFHWLANIDPALQVALLADLADAESGRVQGDDEIESALEDRIRGLNTKYGRDGAGPFHLLLRPRLHNPSQGCWMAWERKRGKLEQLNRMLVEGDASGFSAHVGDRTALSGLRYVITVDADTILPAGSAARLIGALAHPLNRARFDEVSGRVTAGYSIIQPRVEISPRSGQQTLFARLFTGDVAIDIYSRAVSDVYQDLFGAGIFVGKGIYDLHAFHRSVDGRVPENRILSHDLFEGAHGRVALATDIVLYEGFPASYLEYARRLHRWVRGDWQLLPWLGRVVPAAGGRRLVNRIAGIDRWKILDNLRRSLVAPALVLLALAGWLALPGAPWFWTLLVLFAPAGQLFTDLVSGLARGRRRGTVRGLLPSLSDQAGRWLLAIVYLLHEALLSLHAIMATLWRLLATRRRLLAWTTAAQVASGLRARQGRLGIWREMWLGPVIALLTGGVLLVIRPAALLSAIPFLLLWVAAPEITFGIGRRRRLHVEPLDENDSDFLRMLARRTWFYFETFAGPEDNWLPPDNYQADPHEEIAHRTSPTNVGMMLLSTAAAWDLGHIGRAEFAARVGNVFETLGRLERYRGHFFNWYETRTLKPLEPRYVSAVDSGNLAMCLIACAAALREASERSCLELQRWRGLTDLVNLLDQALARLPNGTRGLGLPLAGLRDRLSSLSGMPDSWASELDEIGRVDLPALQASLAQGNSPSAPTEALREAFGWLDRIGYQIRSMQRDLAGSRGPDRDLLILADQAAALANEMDFRPLYDRERRLLHIGHNVSTGRTDPHHYDLLASEARLASFFAIAKRDVPLEHWFRLERPVTRACGGLSLLSWNGSMFEYLMPRLLLRAAPETLLGESERIAAEAQRRYGESNHVPWGISESAYSARDPDNRYRYQAFGVPALGLRRGLGKDMVVAPYASALALAVTPGKAAANLREIALLGAQGRFGLIEALDFSGGHAAGRRYTPVNAYMAHHQGMVLCAIVNALCEDVFVRRIARDPRMRLIALLLSERVPREVSPEIERLEENDLPQRPATAVQIPAPWEPQPGAAFPQMHLLGNGQLSSWVSEAGGGGLRWRGNALTRFVPDPTRDADGLWIYVADEESGALWSPTRQPTGSIPQDYRVLFHPHLAEFHRRDHQIRLTLEVGVAAGVDLEIRRLIIANDGDRPRTLRLTSYGEVALAPPIEDERHPAFSKLFVGGEHLPQLSGLLFTRRPRSPSETPPAMVHFVVGPDGPVEALRFECDRRRFLGRGADVRNPAGARADLANADGWTLDPIMALQLRLELEPYAQREICFVTVAAGTRESAIEIAERHATLASIEWALGDAALEAARAIERSRLAPGWLPSLGILASLLIHPSGALGAEAEKIRANRLGQPHLWGMAISGDCPILLLRSSNGDSHLLKALVSAHRHWRRHGLEIDLVILQTSGSAYAEPIRDDVGRILQDLGASELLGRNGGVHLLFADQIGREQVGLLEAVARVVLDDDGASLKEALVRVWRPASELPQFSPSRPADYPSIVPQFAAVEELLFDNGIGGFTPDGREYVIRLAPGGHTPAPWCNILANDMFGCIVTEAGGGFTWAGNSGENRLTPWTNDPVADHPAETLYLRDEETAAIWTITPGPAGRDEACEIRHGAGYSSWTRRSHGLEQEMVVFVPPDAPVKIVRVRLRNLLGRHRRVTSTYYARWILGALPSLACEHVHCGYDADARAILARSSWNPVFSERVAFLTASRAPHSFTTSRSEFLGREGDPARPAGLTRWGLSGTLCAGQDPCGAYQIHLELAPGESCEVIFALGQGKDEAEAKALAMKWSSPAAAADAIAALRAHWDGILGAVTVHTPDPAFDVIVNRWLIYQSLSSRIMARAGFYQASGAIGFRDQLQDVLALLHVDPGRARRHILLCAAHQFEEGDVLHWWHPPSDRGVRTRCSDDLLWLPYAVGHYVRATGDVSILSEELPFLKGPPLAPEEEDRYARYESGEPRWPLIDHCHRAMERAMTRGAHGLPLIGSGDWNDGMNRLGRAGRGESIWLAWFATATAELVADLNVRLGRDALAQHWRRKSAALRRRAEEAGWDGAWYRRAYDDNGHVVGSAGSDECRIDSISQSWSCFAGADPARTRLALDAAARELMTAEGGLARLLWPPFDRTPSDPGYIKAYPPGVRENGGQYSHAAAWLGIAFAREGDCAKAYEIFGMLNPILRSADRRAAEHYRVEPYVVAADIAAVEPHRGRGGWTWYTGSAAWTWRLGVEEILGLRLADGLLTVDPHLPAGWGGFRAVLRRKEGAIAVSVTDPDGLGHGSVEMTVKGKPFAEAGVAFPTDGSVTQVEARLVK